MIKSDILRLFNTMHISDSKTGISNILQDSMDSNGFYTFREILSSGTIVEYSYASGDPEKSKFLNIKNYE